MSLLVGFSGCNLSILLLRWYQASIRQRGVPLSITLKLLEAGGG